MISDWQTECLLLEFNIYSTALFVTLYAWSNIPSPVLRVHDFKYLSLEWEVRLGFSVNQISLSLSLSLSFCLSPTHSLSPYIYIYINSWISWLCRGCVFGDWGTRKQPSLKARNKSLKIRDETFLKKRRSYPMVSVFHSFLSPRL